VKFIHFIESYPFFGFRPSLDLDPALLVTPPKGLEVGYVPIVIRQEDAGAQPQGRGKNDKTE
jgi:hypothetical protein